MRILSIELADGKKPEHIKMALDEVARQMAKGETSGLVHGLRWKLEAVAEG